MFQELKTLPFVFTDEYLFCCHLEATFAPVVIMIYRPCQQSHSVPHFTLGQRDFATAHSERGETS
jgi:hypothetical protein